MSSQEHNMAVLGQIVKLILLTYSVLFEHTIAEFERMSSPGIKKLTFLMLSFQ